MTEGGTLIPPTSALAGDLSEFRGPVPRPAPTPGGIGKPKSDGPGKRRVRKVADGDEWAVIYEEKKGRCLVCMWLGVRQTLPSTIHHVVSKSLGGDDVPDNAVSLCGDGTTGHHGDVEAHDEETCKAFACALQQFDDAAYAYVVGVLGEDRFLARYKALGVEA